MFKSHTFLLFLISTYSHTRAAIHDEDYLNKNGPFGLITFEKNDSYVDWVRVPESSFLQWTSTLKIWRTVRETSSWSICERKDDALARLVFHRPGHSMSDLCDISSRLYCLRCSNRFQWPIRLLRGNEARGWWFIFHCQCSSEPSTIGATTSAETSSATRARSAAREIRSGSTIIGHHTKFDSTTSIALAKPILLETNDEMI